MITLSAFCVVFIVLCVMCVLFVEVVSSMERTQSDQILACKLLFKLIKEKFGSRLFTGLETQNSRR